MEGMISRVTVEQEPDWLRVQQNVISGINDSMELRLAFLPGGKDGDEAKRLRKELQSRLAKIHEEAFKMAKPNLRVNGYNYEDFIDATQPFDESLDRKIVAVVSERVSWEVRAREKRKTVPETLRRVEQDLEGRRVALEWYPDDVVQRSPLAVREGDIPPPPRHQETKEVFNTVVANLTELNNTASQLHSRAQRAQSVREEIEKLGQ